MNPGITPEAVISALAVMGEARQVLANSNFGLASKIAIAEGRLREQLMQALPREIDVRSAA